MSIISYNVEVVNNTKEIRNIVANTMTLYNEALNYVVDVVKKHFLEIKNLAYPSLTLSIVAKLSST